jgi:CRP-like cAMP-binding protein/Fe-S-cluster-containing hydrogenase component 2
MAAMSDDAPRGPFVRDDDEGLFSRDINGQLVRLDAPTEHDFDIPVTVRIDGRPVTVRRAEPLKDAQGGIVLDLKDRPTPRYTTIYDAAVTAYEEARQEGGGLPDPPWREFPIPVLCHQPHMTPVAVCRLCVVQVWGLRRGLRTPERKLVPACQHQVRDGMEVFTMSAPGEDGERVRRAVRVMTELLTADHLTPAVDAAPARELEPFNELRQVADRCGLRGSRFDLAVLADPTPTPSRPALDDSSPVFTVDHSACILCDRCSRACNEVKHNDVIGRTGKGERTAMGFDLDTAMGGSTCVQCGECMVSCPTSAITFKPVARVKLPVGAHQAEVLSAQELAADPLFAGVPFKFLLWQEGLAVRRRLRAGEVLCRQGEPGNTAFLIRSGSLEVVARSFDARPPRRGDGRDVATGPDTPVVRRFVRGAADLIVGEMACLSGTPRNADVTALEDSEVWEVRRNVLDRIMREPTGRQRFETMYRERVLELALQNAEIFRGLPPDEYEGCVRFLQSRLKFVRVSPRQLIFRQGEEADEMYLIRRGHVRIVISRAGREVTMFYRGPGALIGEIGLLAMSGEDATRSVEDLDRMLSDALLGGGPGGLATARPAGRRTATCSALDDLDLVRIGRTDFLEIVRRFPTLRRRVIRLALDGINEATGAGVERTVGAVRGEYLKQGLYQGRSLLVLDLDRCTRCDECTKACVQQHGIQSHGVPITRLKREGVRFGPYLVATSCRSCKDAYCMVGCPVDAIHRGRHLQIVIEDHCIGCGLCADNCPYGNIFMFPNSGEGLVARPKAATCDLCDADGVHDTPTPRCVYACPHDAAFRLTGEQLLAKVTGLPPGDRQG